MIMMPLSEKIPREKDQDLKKEKLQIFYANQTVKKERIVKIFSLGWIPFFQD